MLKRVLVIFVVITGIYITYDYITELNWFGSADTNSKSVSTKNIDKIEIDISSAEATLIPENRSDIHAELEGEGKLIVEKNGDEVYIEVKGKKFEWFRFNEKRKLKVYIPEDYNESLVINIGSGKLSFSGASSNEPLELNELELNIGSGSVDISNLDLVKFDYEGSSGKITGQFIKTEKSSFEISSGTLKLKEFIGEIDADVSSGTLDIQVEELTAPVKINVSSGKVDLDLPDNADFTLNGKTSSGNISCDFQLLEKDSDKHSLKGKHGSGKNDIDLDISSGKINIY